MKKRRAAKTFYTVFFLASVFLAVYILLEYRESYFAVGASGLIFLIAGYLLVNRTEKEKSEAIAAWQQEEKILQEKLDMLSNVGKAVYTVLKKGGVPGRKHGAPGRTTESMEQEDLTQQLQKILKLQEEALLDSKKTAEIQINSVKMLARYDKENAKQLALAANENTDRIVENLKNLFEDLKLDLEHTLEQAIRNAGEQYQSMAELMHGMPGMPDTAAEAEAVEEAPEEMEIAIPEIAPIGEISEEEESTAVEKRMEEPEEIPVPAPVLSDDPNHAMTPDEIAAFIASMGGGSSEPPETEAVEEAPEEMEIAIPEIAPIGEVSEEPESMAAENDINEKSEPEEIPVPAPVLSDDPNHAMTPDEIAALIASLGK